MEKNGKLDPSNPENWKKVQQEMQDEFGHLFEVENETQSEAVVNSEEDKIEESVESEKENSFKKTRRGRGGKPTTPSAETKAKRRSKENIAEEEFEIRNYLDRMLIGSSSEVASSSLGREKVRKLRDLAVRSMKADKDYELMSLEEKKQKALDMIIYEVDKELIGFSDKESNDFKVLNTIRNSLEKNRGGMEDESNADKILKTEEDIKRLKNEIDASKNGLERVKKGSKKEGKILERMKLQEEQLGRLEFERDMLTGEDIEIINDSIGKGGRIKKIVKKNGMGTTVDSGEEFVVSLKNNPNKGESIFFDSAPGGIKNTSGVLNIKKCLDGSYIVETNTSFYRLWVDKNENEEGGAEKDAENENINKKETKGSTEDSAKEEGGDKKEKSFPIDEAYNRLKSLGAEDEDIKYFFNLNKSERNEFLNSGDDDLMVKIEELKKLRNSNDQKEEILAEDAVSQRFSRAGGNQEDIDYFYGNLNKEEREEIFGLSEDDFKIKIDELREERNKNAGNYRDDFSPEEINNRLDKIGIIEDEKKYFFRLSDENKLDFLNSDDEELKLRIEKLREAGIKEANEKIIPATRELEERRREYLQKENEIKNTLARIKNFFRHMMKEDKYEAETELEDYKQRYEEALRNYSEVIVDAEGLNDAEEREIMYRYVKFGETLSLMDAKADIEFQKHPMWESLKRDVGVGSLSLIDKYKEILGKSREYITQKTGSKLLGIGGGAIAVGGAMSFLSGTIPGLRGFTRAMSIAVATKGFYDKAEMEAIVEKESETRKEINELEQRFNYLQNFQDKIDKTFKEEISYLIKDIPESAQKERDEVTKRLMTSLGKATLLNIAFYQAGKALKDSGILEEGVEAVKKFFGQEGLDSDFGEVTGNEKKVDISDISKESEATEGSPESREISGIETSRSQGQVLHQGPVVPRPEMNQDGQSIESDQKVGIRRLGGFDNESSQVVENHSSTPERKLGSAVEFGESKSGFSGINLDEVGRGEIDVIKGRGIKDSLANILAKNSQNLTDGKMGWNPEKYKSVEEWANRRAVGIVAELKEKYPNYNFDKVSEGTKLSVDFSNRSDIKIVGFDDPKHLGGSQSTIRDLENIKASSPTENKVVSLESEPSQAEVGGDVEKIKIEINRANTLKEASIVQSLGFKPDEYAELNDVSVRRLLDEFRDSGNPNDANFKLKGVMKRLIEEYKSDIMDKNISDVIREMDSKVAENVIKDFKIIPPNEYGSFVDRMIRWEFELGMSEDGPRKVFLGLGEIRNRSIKECSGEEVFLAFRGAVEKLGISFAYNNDDSVKSYVMKAMIRSYEDGKIGKLREALKIINENIKK